MLKINKTIVDDTTPLKEQVKIGEEFVKDNTPKSKDESLHVIVSVDDGYMYVYNYKGNKSLNLSLGTNNGLISLNRDNSEETINPEDIASFLTKGKNLYLLKIVHKDGKFSSIDMLSIMKEDETLELVDATEFEDRRNNKILVTLGVNYWKEVFTLEDF
jgi:hypothetical protein